MCLLTSFCILKERSDFNGKITNDTKEPYSAIELGYRLIDTTI